MANVVTFSRLPDEETRFLSYLEKTGDILACTGERVSDPTSEVLKPRPIRQLIKEHNPQQMFIGPREFMNMAQIDSFELDGQVRYGRFYMYVPLVSYSRGMLREHNQLEESNLAFVTTRGNADLVDHVWTPQPPEFIAWGKRVLGWARRHAPRVVEHKRMTERVYAELANGLELVP